MTNWSIWNSGIPIEAALITCADNSLRRKYVAACQLELKRSKNDPSNGTEIWPVLEEAAKLLPEAEIYEARDFYHPNAPPDVIKDWQKEFLELTTSGKVQSIGFSAPRSPESSPKFIPQDTWEGWVNWQEGAISANGLSFVGVRIVNPKALSNKQLNEIKIGRPSKKDQITKAFHELENEGLINFSGPMRTNYPAIRRWIQTNFPDAENGERGLGDKTMARIVNPLITGKK
ncbi:MAG: hypothetical protein NXI13_17600 [Proteobacteria bacterium]|nr:hypothetical protein [Pseudomonadota bacterium]